MLLPDPEAPHNRMARVTIPAPEMIEDEVDTTIAAEIVASAETLVQTAAVRAGATLH